MGTIQTTGRGRSHRFRRRPPQPGRTFAAVAAVSPTVTGARAALADIVDLSAEAFAAIGLLVADRLSYELVQTRRDRPAEHTSATESVRTTGGVGVEAARRGSHGHHRGSAGRASSGVVVERSDRHPFVRSGSAVWPDRFGIARRTDDR